MNQENHDDDPLVRELQALQHEIRESRRIQTDWRLRLRDGMIAGLGGVLGATLVLSLIIYFLQPFKSIAGLGPLIDKLDQTVTRQQK